MWLPLSCRVLPTCWLSRANEQSLLRIGFKSILAQNICVASFLYLCIHELCICVFADWDKLTRSPKQPRLGMSFKSILTQPKLFAFLKENAANCAQCLFIFTDNVYSNNIGTRGDWPSFAFMLDVAALSPSFNRSVMKFSGQVLNCHNFWSCLFVKILLFLCIDFS